MGLVTNATRSQLIRQAFRFLVVGGLNTVFTGIVFYGLSRWLPQPAAYAVAYGVGILIAGWVIPRFVFRRASSAATSRLVSAGYLVVLLLGLALVWELDRAGLARGGVVVVTLALTVPANFVVSRAITLRTNEARR